MKTNGNGWFAALGVALAAALGISVLPPRANSPGAGAAAQPKEVSAERGAPTPNTLEAPCQAIEARMRPFLPPGAVFAPRGCFADSTKTREWSGYRAGKNPAIQMLLVTLPDPVHTHFAVEFDRLVNALQQAVQDQGYVYDSSWLPWLDPRPQYSGLRDQDRANSRLKLREEQPGILVFRDAVALSRTDSAPGTGTDPYQRGLFLFIVGEKPTGGIDSAQFRNAIAWMKALRPNGTGQSLGIVGPFFSGSLPSLAQLLGVGMPARQSSPNTPQEAKNVTDFLKANRELPLKGAQEKLLIFSGTTTSRPDIQWFSESLKQPNEFLLPARFITFQEDDDLLINRYCAMLDQQGYRTDRLAILSEDETAYGQMKNPADAGGALSACTKNYPKGPLSLHYPRDIASLRTAYAKQAPAAPAQATGAGGLAGTLSEADLQSHDSIRTYGGEQTAASEDARLFELVHVLKQHRIQFILLRSSNVLDQIFLTSFFSRMDPDARVVLLRSDLMLSRGIGSQSLRGTITLNTYPLLAAQGDWTYAPENRSHGTFEDSDSQGVYMATRFLIDRQARSPGNPWTGSDPHNPSALLQEYGPPWWCKNRTPNSLPTWVSVLSQGRIWPVAVLGDDERPAANGPPPTSIRSLGFKPPEERAPDPLRLPMSTQVFFGLMALWCGWHLYCCWSGSQTASPRCRTYFAPHRGLQHQFLILIGSLLLSLVAVISLNLIRATNLQHPLFAHSDWLTIFFWSLTVLALLAILGNYLRAPEPVDSQGSGTSPSPSSETGEGSARAVRPESWRQRLREVFNRKAIAAWSRSRPWSRVLIDGLLFVSLTVAAERLFFLWLVKPLGIPGEAFTIWRSVNLLSGVSPLTPLVLLIGGAYGWFWYTLMGLAHFNEDRARLPEKRDLDPKLPMFSQEWLGEPIERVAKPLGPIYAGFLLPGLIVAIGSVFAFASSNYSNDFSVRSLASSGYGRLYACCIFLFVAVILADTIQLLWVWSRFRQLLVFLDRLPLRRTLHALKGFTWGTTWKMSGSVFQNRYKVLSREFESFGHLRNELHHAMEEEALHRHPPCSLEKPPELDEDFLAQLRSCGVAMEDFVTWYRANGQKSNVLNLSTMQRYQSELAKTAGALSTAILVPQWQKERESLIQDLVETNHEAPTSAKDDQEFPPIPEFQREAEEFFAWPYLDFIQSILGRIRTIAMGILSLFVAATLSVVSYPFDPRPLLGGIFLAVFVLVGSTVAFVYGSMHRDATLSHITNTTPGQLGWAFWVKLAALGVGPLLALLTTLFPGIAGFVTSWLQPSVQTLQ